MSEEDPILEPVAIIGMSGRFPGAADIEEFWENLVAGTDTITHFSEQETEFSVASEEAKARGEKFVRARGILKNADEFDAEFFGIRPREAEIMDPQHRIFLECAWEALEVAGYDPAVYEKLIGVYAGISLNTYLLYNLCGGNHFSSRLAGDYQVGEYSTTFGNDKDFMPTRVAYKLNLRGPAMAIQCACSTSLVAISQACTALQTYQCDMALAGGASVTFPQRRDYRYEDDGMVSPDGTCRAFDADAKGTVFGHGAAVILLKRLSDAQADGDTILAVIRGSAVNNDGSDKIGYAAPGVNAQAEVIGMAQAAAGVSPNSISYIEAHGTGTPLGDPIEVAALTKAFREGGAKGNGFCAIGAGKTYTGHLDAAAGAAGVIKTVLQLQNNFIPPLLHFKAPNPRIDFANSPFKPVANAIPWKKGSSPRRAGVSAFGVGGTNVHVIIEEAPAATPTSQTKAPQLLLLSARTPSALNAMCARLADHLKKHRELNIADVAFTLAKGRRAFKCRRGLVVADRGSAITALRESKHTAEDRRLLDLASKWTTGESPDLAEVFGNDVRRRVPLPTYPFERKSFWVEPGEIERETLSEASEEDVEGVPSVSQEPQDRLAELTAALARLMEELSGSPLADYDAKFSELGFDSLFLTQVSQAVHSRYEVKVTFRQLLNEVSSVTLLAARLNVVLPASAPIKRPAKSVKTTGTSHLPAIHWPGTTPNSAKETSQKFGPYRPIERGDDGGLTKNQRKALDDLIFHYTSRTGASKRYTEEHRAHYADPRAISGFQSLWKEMVYPIVSSRSKGSAIWDVDGNAYVDLTMGFGTYFFGHSPDWLVAAEQRQLQQGIEIGPQSEMAGSIARDICEFTGMERATFCNTGSEAVMAAIRLARTVTGRSRIVYFTGDYHGMFDEVLVRGSWVNGEYRAQPIAPGIPPSLVENMLVLDYAAPESLEILRAHAGEIAAVLVEPVQSRHPDLQPKTFMRELRAITERSGTALIFDEVVTGFRCHPGGAQAYFGVKADMATYGKVVGGGIPIGVLAGKRTYMDALDGGAWNYGDDSFPEVGMTFFAGTFVRHPLAMAAARAVLDRLREEGPGLQLRMGERTTLLCRTLNTWFESVGAPIRIPHFSAFAVIEHAPDLRHISLLWYYLREKGIHIWENRPIYLTLAHTDEDFDKVIRAFQESVTEMQEAGFLPTIADRESKIAPLEFPRIDSAPSTEAQREIWASTQMGDEANCAYNESNVIELKGSLDRAALEKSILHVIQRHPALRSTFSEDGELQLFQPAPEQFALSVIDLSTLPEKERAARYAKLRSEGTGIPFDLVQGPLWRLQLVALAPDTHALFITAHHMISDGWSFGMIVDELSHSYNAFLVGHIPMLPPALAFGDYARSLMGQSDERDAARDYWIAQFQEPAPALELPTDRSRPPLKSYAGAMETRVVDAERFARLKKAVPQLGGTLFVNLLSVFATLLHRFSGQDDLVIGVPSAGQTSTGYDALVGHCLNFLPLRVHCTDDLSFGEFASKVSHTIVDAYEHQSYTFGSLVRALKLPRDTSRLPLVSVMFNIDNSGFDHLHFDGLSFRVLTNAKQFVNFDLFFNLVQSEKNLEIECEYNTDLYDASTIRRWLASFELLIESILSSNEKPLSVLPVMTVEEKTTLLKNGEGTVRDYARERPVHVLVSEIAVANPKKIAVRYNDMTLTYGELESRANQLATHLQSLGVTSGNYVGLFIERSIDMVVGLLGILKTGAAYVPMDPAFPAERLQFMLEDAKIESLVTHSSLRDRLPSSAVKAIQIDALPSDIAKEFTPSERGGEHPVYMIFTSGSTGRPKGVIVPHRALVNFLFSMRREPGMNADDVFFAVTTLSFDISGLEIFLPLTIGATVVIASGDTLADGNLLRDALERSEATVMQATPSTWRLLLEAKWPGNKRLKILIGGEAVPLDLIKHLLPCCASLWNVYGPTETTIWSTTTRLLPRDESVSIGRPIDNTQVYVVNAELQLQPTGIPGELLIGGDGLALGYLDRPELTAERFIPDTFSEKPGSRLYRTGDIALWTADGRLECLGRLDNQVKVRGYRIELGEIESFIEKYPGVQQVAMMAKKDGQGHSRLIAYIVPEESEKNKELSEGLRQYIAEKLPAYMIPSFFIFLKRMPLTPNGKVDRRALLALGQDMGDQPASSTFVPPGSKTEKLLAEIWRQVIGIERIGIHDDIFEIGGDSILIFRITARANQAGLKLLPTQIFQHRTIAQLANLASIENTDAPSASIQRLDRDAYRRNS